MAAFSDTAFSTSAFSVSAFDFGIGPAPIPPPPGPTPSGGFPARDRLHLPRRGRKEISEERKKLGLEDAYALEIQAVIAEVAKGQVRRLELDEQKRFEELHRELQLRGLEWRARYLEVLSQEREALINAEIALLLRRKLDDEQIILMLLFMAAAA